MSERNGQRHLLTIGHSNHRAEQFLALVQANHIEVIADVRSWPRSRFTDWADVDRLPDLLRSIGCRYVFLGGKLGGRPSEDACYDREGHVLYSRVARTPSFREGLERLKRGLTDYHVAVMCSEESPGRCHRRLLIAKVLIDEGVPVTHVRGNGRLEREEGIAAPDDLRLFDDEDRWWRSLRSVSPKRPLKSSLPA